jgi:hypothetical protein
MQFISLFAILASIRAFIGLGSRAIRRDDRIARNETSASLAVPVPFRTETLFLLTVHASYTQIGDARTAMMNMRSLRFQLLHRLYTQHRDDATQA